MSGAADANDDDDDEGKKDFFEEHAYEILAFCYQLGVLFSRSSLSFVRIRRIWLLTGLQGANFALWLLQDEYRFLPLWAQFPLMVFVGLLGGAMYVNVFALMVDDASIPKEDKEFGINVVGIWNNVGIMSSSVFDLIMDATWMKNK